MFTESIFKDTTMNDILFVPENDLDIVNVFFRGHCIGQVRQFFGNQKWEFTYYKSIVNIPLGEVDITNHEKELKRRVVFVLREGAK